MIGRRLTGSRSLNKDKIEMLDLRGVCISCHATEPDHDVAINLLSHVAKYSNTKIDNDKHKSILNKSVRFGAWGQLLLTILAMILAVFIFIKWKKSKN